MANAQQVTAATVAVSAGTASRDQANLVARAAQQRGSAGNAARAAQKAAGKK